MKFKIPGKWYAVPGRPDVNLSQGGVSVFDDRIFPSKTLDSEIKVSIFLHH